MPGECDECGEHALECECYEKCKCDKHPATHEIDFEIQILEYGIRDKLLIYQIDATCKNCKDKFKFTQVY